MGAGANESEPFRGDDVIKQRYFVMSILAKRRSGKTTLIASLIDTFADKSMIVILIGPTLHKDTAWLAIQARLKKRGIQFESHTSIHDTETGENIIERNMALLRDTPDQVDIFWIFDDISSELRHKSISTLTKNSRHYRSKIIISSQSIVDLTPSVHAQVDATLLFGSFNDRSLMQIWSRIEPPLSESQFIRLYHQVTKEPFQFLFIDRDTGQFRKNLDQLIHVVPK